MNGRQKGRADSGGHDGRRGTDRAERNAQQITYPSSLTDEDLGITRAPPTEEDYRREAEAKKEQLQEETESHGEGVGSGKTAHGKTA